MIRRQVWAMGAAALLGVVVGLLSQPARVHLVAAGPPRAAPESPAPEDKGEGHFAVDRVNDNRIVLVDTTTGHCWGKALGAPDWEDWGSPADARKPEHKRPSQ